MFESIASARGYLEVPDVETGVYGPAFDAEGRLLAVEIPTVLFEPQPERGLRRKLWRAFRSFNPVEVRVVEDVPTHQAQLKKLLTSVLDKSDASATEGTSELQLEELLARVIARYGVI